MVFLAQEIHQEMFSIGFFRLKIHQEMFPVVFLTKKRLFDKETHLFKLSASSVKLEQ